MWSSRARSVCRSLRVGSRTWAGFAAAIAVVLSAACGTNEPATGTAPLDAQWLYSPDHHPSGVEFDRTEFKDPEFADYADNPVHHYRVVGIDQASVLDWYRDNLPDQGWRVQVQDSNQLTLNQNGASARAHILIVDTTTPRDTTFASFTIEEYEIER